MDLHAPDGEVARASDAPAQASVGDDFQAGGRVADNGQVAFCLDARVVQIRGRGGVLGDDVLADEVDRCAIGHDDGGARRSFGDVDARVVKRQGAGRTCARPLPAIALVGLGGVLDDDGLGDLGCLG